MPTQADSQVLSHQYVHLRNLRCIHRCNHPVSPVCIHRHNLPGNRVPYQPINPRVAPVHILLVSHHCSLQAFHHSNRHHCRVHSPQFSQVKCHPCNLPCFLLYNRQFVLVNSPVCVLLHNRHDYPPNSRRHYHRYSPRINRVLIRRVSRRLALQCSRAFSLAPSRVCSQRCVHLINRRPVHQCSPASSHRCVHRVSRRLVRRYNRACSLARSRACSRQCVRLTNLRHVRHLSRRFSRACVHRVSRRLVRRCNRACSLASNRVLIQQLNPADFPQRNLLCVLRDNQRHAHQCSRQANLALIHRTNPQSGRRCNRAFNRVNNQAPSHQFVPVDSLRASLVANHQRYLQHSQQCIHQSNLLVSPARDLQFSLRVNPVLIHRCIHPCSQLYNRPDNLSHDLQGNHLVAPVCSQPCNLQCNPPTCRQINHHPNHPNNLSCIPQVIFHFASLLSLVPY